MFTELAQELIPSNSPYFGTVERGDGQTTEGNGDGSGVFDFSQYGGPVESPAQGENVMQGGIGAAQLEQWLASQGYKLMEAPQPGRKVARWLVDQNGQMVGQPQINSTDDRATFYSGLLALGVAGGLAAGAGAGAAEAGAGATAGAGSGAGAGAGAAGAGDALALSAGAGAEGGSLAWGMEAIGAEGAAGAAGGAGAGTAGGAGASSGGLGSLLGGSGAGGWVSPALQAGGALMNQYQAGKVLDAQTAANGESNALLRTMYDTQRADMAPYREVGTSALSQIQALLKAPSSVANEPGYKFGLDQGIKARENSAAARGMAFSGPQQKALTQYGNDYASSKLNDTFNRYATVAGLGQVGATGSANAAGNYGGQVANNALNLGNAQGSAYAATANGWNNAFGNIANTYQQNQLLELLKKQNGGP